MSLKIPQKTLENRCKLLGFAIHNRDSSAISIIGAEPNTGILFTDYATNWAIRANIINAEYAGNGRKTTMLKSDSMSVLCVEHVLAALYLRGITNAEIICGKEEDRKKEDEKEKDKKEEMSEYKECEIPMYDGSISHIIEAIDNAGVVAQEEMVKKAYRITQEISVYSGERFVRVSPVERYSGKNHLQMDVEVDFKNPGIPPGRLNLCLDRDIYDRSIMDNLIRARTFCNEEVFDDIEKDKRGTMIGMARKYMVIIDKNGDPAVGQKGGFSFAEEPVTHKTVDMIGDLSLLQFPLIAHVQAYMPGHELNLALAKRIYEEAQKQHGKAQLINL
jgi:UDP-3-O-[3-hydroxymyristoyl] N-acetylglucosamine deacetylase